MGQTVAELRREVEALKQQMADLEPKMKETNRLLQQERVLLTSTMALAVRMGLPENVDDAVTKLLRIITILNQMRIAAYATQAALLGTGPVGWALVGVGWAGAAVSTYSMLEYETRGH